MRAGVGHGGLRRLLHHVAQLSREPQSPLAADRQRFDEEDVPADRRPGQTGRDANLVSLQELVGEVLDGSEHLFDGGGGDAVAARLSLRDGHRHLATDRADLPLEVAEAGLPRVCLDDLPDAAVGELDVRLGDAVLLHLLRDQVALRDRELLLDGVAGQADDLHAVQERGLDRVEDVRRGDEEHLREVVGHVQVVVAEREVLLRVEDLEEGRARIAPVVRADLVDLVEHEHRVRRAGLVEALDDPAGHRADVGPPMAPDLGFVSHASKGQPDELPVESAGDGAAERRLTDAGRPHEAEDRSLERLLQGVHREKFEDALLHLLDVVVVLVQDGAGAIEVAGVFRERRPRKSRHPVEVGADDRGLGGVGVASLQALDLLLDLRGRLRRDLLRGDRLAVVFELLGELLPLAELLLDRAQLLAQVVLALRPVHLAARLGRNLLLHRQDRDFPGEVLVDEPQPLDGVGALEDALRVLQLQLEVRGREVRQPGGVREVRRDHHDLGRDRLAERDRFLQVLLDAPHERLLLRRQLLLGRGLFEPRDLHLQVRLFGEHRVDARAGDALDEQARAPVRQLQHPHDRGHGADGVEVGLGRRLGLGASLSDQHDDPLLGERRVDRVDRPLARHRKRQDDVRKDDDVLQGKDRKDVGDREIGFPIRHGLLFVEFGELVHHYVISSSAFTATSTSFSRRSGTRGRITSSRPRESFVFAWRELTGRGIGTDFRKDPKYRSMQ